jgi:hypothetical protein
VIPLVRSADPKKANAEVLDYNLWPCDRRKLIDDLWALALANLAAMPSHVAAVNADAPLTGRNLEPWKGILAVAHWLEAEGETGLYARMCQLARDYQTERVDLETPDLTRLVVRALIDEIVPSVPSVPSAKWGVPIEFNVSAVVDKVHELAVAEGLTDEDETDEGDGGDGKTADLFDLAMKIGDEKPKKPKKYASAKRLGKVLTALRIRHATRTAMAKRRQVSPAELYALAQSYGLTVPFVVPNDPPLTHSAHSAQTAQTAQQPPLPHNGANGANGAEHADEAARLLALAKAAGWPSVPIKPWLSVAQGEDGWHRFVRTASAEDIRTAMAALEKVEVAA